MELDGGWEEGRRAPVGFIDIAKGLAGTGVSMIDLSGSTEV